MKRYPSTRRKNYLSLGYLTDLDLALRVEAYQDSLYHKTGLRATMAEMVKLLIRKGLDALHAP